MFINDFDGLGTGYYSKAIHRFLDEPNYIKTPTLSYDDNREITQYIGTTLEIYNLTNYISNILTYGYTNLNKSDENNVIQFFNNHRGRHKKFWIPMWKHSFKLLSNITANDDILTIENANYNLIENSYDRIFIKLKTGQFITKQVSIVTVSSDTEYIFLDTKMNQNINISDIKFFSRFLLCRFSVDSLKIKYLSFDKSECSLTFNELPFEYPQDES